MRRDRAFTLIELLVVISIISILSSVVLSSLNTARAKARDTRRISDFRQIQIALEQYYQDYGRYPASQGPCSSATTPNSAWCNSVENYNGTRWIAGGALSPYLPRDPVDPVPHSTVQWGPNNDSGGTYFYFSYANTSANGCGPGQYYILIGGMEIASNRKNTFRLCDGSGYSGGGTYTIGQSVP